MGQTTINNGDSGLTVRTALNSMFGEIYGTYIRATWFAEIASGTSGTLTPPTGSTIVLDAWSGDVDALVSEMPGTGELPSFTTAYTSGSVAITGTLDVDGNWTLSGTPASYPVALIFVYRIPVPDFDYTKSLDTAIVEPLHDSTKLDVTGGTLARVYETFTGPTNISTNTTLDLSASNDHSFVITTTSTLTMPAIPTTYRMSGIIDIVNASGQTHSWPQGGGQPVIRWFSESDAGTTPTPAADTYMTRYTYQNRYTSGRGWFWAMGIAGKDTA